MGCACAGKCIGCDSVGGVFWWCGGYWSHPGELRICSKCQLHSTTLTISLHLVPYWKWWVLPLKGGMFPCIRNIFGCHVIFMWIYRYPEHPVTVASWTEHDPHFPNQKDDTPFPLPTKRHFPETYKSCIIFHQASKQD